MDPAVELYRKMALIRAFETRLDALFASGSMRGTSHLCIGQEACAVGACAGLRPDDYAVSNHRGHGHFIAKGGDPKRLLAELFGKETGYSHGRGGSQHMACYEIGFLGSNGITGGGIPVAVGAALGLQLQKRDQVVLSFFGDGASNQGTFHESLNLASIWKLPVIFFCENNLYAMSTPARDAMAVSDVAARATAYGMPGRIVDGNDVLAVQAAVGEAAERTRRGGGPELIEAKTYRVAGHSKSDRCEYRREEEERVWREERDPIRLLAAKLLEEGALDNDGIEAINAQAQQQIDDAVEFATNSPDPDPEGLEGWVFA